MSSKTGIFFERLASVGGPNEWFGVVIGLGEEAVDDRANASAPLR
jgi:hypothetical protein